MASHSTAVTVTDSKLDFKQSNSHWFVFCKWNKLTCQIESLIKTFYNHNIRHLEKKKTDIESVAEVRHKNTFTQYYSKSSGALTWYFFGLRYLKSAAHCIWGNIAINTQHFGPFYDRLEFFNLQNKIYLAFK